MLRIIYYSNISMIMNGNDQAKMFAMVLFTGLIVVIIGIKQSGIFSKETREQIKKQKQIDEISGKLGELDNLYQSGIINENEYNLKKSELENLNINILVDQQLIIDKDYISILKAFKNGLISEKQKNVKINNIREKIIRDLNN